MEKKIYFLILPCHALPVEVGHSPPVTAKFAIGVWIYASKQTELFDATECKISSA